MLGKRHYRFAGAYTNPVVLKRRATPGPHRISAARPAQQPFPNRVPCESAASNTSVAHTASTRTWSRAASDEARDLIRFRDLLRDDISLRRAYEAEKRAILARGIVKGTEYSKAKGEFIRRALAPLKSSRT